MTLSKYFLFAAGCTLICSCSSDEPGDGAQSGTTYDEAYASFKVNLPQVLDGATSRAATDEAGLPSEYSVINGKVLVFEKGSTEADAKFVCAGELTGMSWSTNTSGEITTSSAAVARLSDIKMGDASATYSAAIVLNYGEDFIMPASGETFGHWSQQPQTSSMNISTNKGKGLTMTSAPRHQGANAEPVTLVDIDKSKIAASESELSGPAASFYVQRVLAKVSVVSQSEYTVASSTYSNDKVTITGWDLDITNKTTYPLQVTAGLKEKFDKIWETGRFFNGSAFTRTHWAKDPNYSLECTTLEEVNARFNTIQTINGKPGYRYVMENTFDIFHQLQGQTTRVVLKAQYTPAGFAAKESFYKIGANSLLWKYEDLKAEITARAKTQQNSDNVTVEFPEEFATAGYHSLSELTIRKGTTKITSPSYDAIAKSLGLADSKDAAIAAYASGETYYVARIKHFGDAECPWQVGDYTYGGDNAKWLGRYGVVRNNWYEISINSISNPGSPSVPVIKPDTPDDENDYIMSVTVNLLSWAKRVHQYEL